MSQEKRSATFVHAAAAMLIGMVFSACSAGTHSAASVQIPDAAARPSDSVDSESALAEIVVTAGRLAPARVAEQTSSRPPVKRRG
jgi:hypothetical protein